MPIYRFHAVGSCLPGCADFQKELGTLEEARHEAKRFARQIFDGDRIADRIEVEQLGVGLALVVPASEGVWQDA